MSATLSRARRFAESLGLEIPVLLAPMAGSCPPALSIAVAKAGGMGACGALLMTPDEIAPWCDAFRASGASVFQINLWTPDPPPQRNPENEARMREFLSQWGPLPDERAGEARPPDFAAQFEAVLQARPTAISTIMGLFEESHIRRMRSVGVKWFATATTVREAKAAARAGANAIIAQGAEAGGHRGAFNAAEAERAAVGLFSLVPAIVDAVDRPVIAAGGVADGRGAAAAFALGASAVMAGTVFLRSPEAAIPSAWADRLADTAPEDTMLTRAFSGRAGRAIANEYVRSVAAMTEPTPASYPVQRGLSAAMRAAAATANDVERMQAWAGQSAMLAKAMKADDIARELWRDAQRLLA